jgi:hypothetical protein
MGEFMAGDGVEHLSAGLHHSHDVAITNYQPELSSDLDGYSTRRAGPRVATDGAEAKNVPLRQFRGRLVEDR